jgi:hypothetical protein
VSANPLNNDIVNSKQKKVLEEADLIETNGLKEGATKKAGRDS